MERKIYASLRNKILVATILVPVVPFLLVLVTGYHFFTSSLEAETRSHIARIAEDHRGLIERFLEERRKDLVLVAESYGFPDLRRTEVLAEVFERLSSRSRAFSDLGVFDGEGVHLAYVGPYELTGKLYREAPWFRQVWRDGFCVCDVFLGYRNVPHFVIAVAREDPDGRWVLRATIDSRLFTDIVEKIRVGKTGEAYILNAEGVFQTERRSGGSLLERDTDETVDLRPHEGVRTFRALDRSGTEFLYATAWLRGDRWLLVVRQEETDAFGVLNTAVRVAVLITMLGLGAIVGVAFFVTSRLIGRIESADREKGQLAQQLIVAGRLAEIGEMSAGLAHEINNPLQIIRAEQALVESILDDRQGRGELPEGDETDDLLDSVRQIKIQTDRCGQITSSLLDFARPKEPAPRPIDPGKFVRGILERMAGKASVNGITLRADTPDDLPRVIGSPTRLQQVLLNLLNNAFDAVTERHGGQGGEVAVRVEHLDGSVRVSVSDNGTGISAANRERVFTPFFTTKPVGKGTGLGLSVCFGIVSHMGGSIRMESREGEGTTIEVSLPAES